jgi:hypothetical protein
MLVPNDAINAKKEQTTCFYTTAQNLVFGAALDDNAWPWWAAPQLGGRLEGVLGRCAG